MIKRWTLENGEIEFFINKRIWTIGFSFDWDMYYLNIGPFHIGYAPEDSIGWRG